MKFKAKYLSGAYFLMLIVIFVLPYFSDQNYSIIKHTTSELGAQNTPNSWIMNLTFIILGSASILDGWKFLKAYKFHKFVLTFFGISLILSALYKHAPIDATINYNIKEDDLHSLFSSITGFLFTLFAISTSFILEKRKDKLIAVLIGISATLLSVLIFNVSGFAGIWQRLIFISAFGWMIYLLNTKLKPIT